MMLLVVTGIGTLIHIYSTAYMFVMAGGIDLITIFIGLETMAVSFYILAGFIKPNQRSNEAAVKYFLLGAFSLGILLYGMSLMYGLSGTTNLRTMATVFSGQEQDPRLVLAVILVVAGVGFKIAAVPFHMWAPDVYEGAPTPVTAFLSVGSKAASFAMLLRIFVEGLGPMQGDWRLLFEALSIVTMDVEYLPRLAVFGHHEVVRADRDERPVARVDDRGQHDPAGRGLLELLSSGHQDHWAGVDGANMKREDQKRYKSAHLGPKHPEIWTFTGQIHRK